VTYATLQQQDLPPPRTKRGQVGRASYYHDFFDGRKTRAGRRQQPDAYGRSPHPEFGTAFGSPTFSNLKSVIVTINDRGPYVSGRIIDLRAARECPRLRPEWVTRVRVEPLL